MDALTAISRLAPTLAMLAVFLLVWGGLRLIRRGPENRTKGVLMLVCAGVLLGNVLIWTV